MKLGFIGAGKAGNSLARYLKSPEIQISGFYSKTEKHAKQAADQTGSAVFYNLKDIVSASDIIFITTPDGIIGEVWDTIRREAEPGSLRGKIFCHCSGSLSAEVFTHIRTYGAFGCSLHPMQAISGKETDLTGTFFTADGQDEAVGQVRKMLQAKGNPVGIIESECKKKYHMAASAASNLVVGIVQMAVVALEECGFTEETALQMLTPLLLGNMENICGKGTAAALTGPLERGDSQTVKGHLDQLTGEKKEIYRLLSKQLLEVAQKKNQMRDYSDLKNLLEEKDQ
ncbi:DUF2520 domain-containing protein [bacterium 210820-DFI.6.37]|nr:DUF2520 domain-containing protein [bacterium 210820-DFI.6.37]